MTTENIIMTMVKVQSSCQELYEFFCPFPESNCSYKTKSDYNDFTVHVRADATQRGKRETKSKVYTTGPGCQITFKSSPSQPVSGSLKRLVSPECVHTEKHGPGLQGLQQKRTKLCFASERA